MRISISFSGSTRGTHLRMLFEGKLEICKPITFQQEDHAMYVFIHIGVRHHMLGTHWILTVNVAYVARYSIVLCLILNQRLCIIEECRFGLNV